jgi:hypothetical protein
LNCLQTRLLMQQLLLLLPLLLLLLLLMLWLLLHRRLPTQPTMLRNALHPVIRCQMPLPVVKRGLILMLLPLLQPNGLVFGMARSWTIQVHPQLFFRPKQQQQQPTKALQRMRWKQ